MRLVTHYLRSITGEPLSGEVVTFELLKTGRSGNVFYPKKIVSVLSNDSGLVEAWLWTNAESECEAKYRVHLPGCDKFDFLLPPGDTPMPLGVLKESGVSWENPQFLTTVNYLKENARDLELEVTVEKSYIHTQSAIANQWIVNHNLDKYPSVATVNTLGEPIEGIPQYIDTNNLRILFSPAVAGVAYLN